MKRIALTILMLASLCFTSAAQQFVWNLDFSYYFNNMEYARSHELFDVSGTVNAARLTPSIGVAVAQGENIRHRLMGGVDMLKNMGEGVQNLGLFKEITCWYDVNVRFGDDSYFSAAAGCFPRSFSEGDYRGPFFDGNTLFYDNNLEGMFFKFRNRRVYAEIGLDWLGMIGDAQNPDRHERFQVLSSGSWNFTRTLSLRWTGMFYHYACSPNNPVVIDNHMIYPHLQWEPDTWFDSLSINAGYILTYQWDRKHESNVRTPSGFYSTQTLSKWHVGLENRFYAGDDLQPLYATYGSDLYMGEPSFHTLSGSTAMYDRLAVYYRPHVTGWMDLTVAAVFNFGSPSPDAIIPIPAYRGCRQVCALTINLDRLYER